MKGLQLFLFIFTFSVTEQTTAQRDVCPPWFIPDNTSITGYSCHQDGAKVQCGTDFVSLHFGFCMTYNNKTGGTEFGACPYIAHYNTTPFNVSYLFKCRVMCPYLMNLCVTLSPSLFWEQHCCYSFHT